MLELPAFQMATTGGLLFWGGVILGFAAIIAAIGLIIYIVMSERSINRRMKDAFGPEKFGDVYDRANARAARPGADAVFARGSEQNM